MPMQMVLVHLHTLCWDLSQLYGFCHTSQSTRASLKSECNKHNCQNTIQTLCSLCTEQNLLQHQPVLVVGQQQIPSSSELLEHSPNAYDFPRFSASAVDLVAVSLPLMPKSMQKQNQIKI